MIKRWAVALVISFPLVIASGCLSWDGDPKDPSIKVVNAYCDNNGFFNFTLVNRANQTADLEFSWALNDPKADDPVFKGEGNCTIGPKDQKPIIIIVDFNGTIGDYNSAILVMYVNVFVDGEKEVEYRRQKSPIALDYSTLPPTKKD